MRRLILNTTVSIAVISAFACTPKDSTSQVSSTPDRQKEIAAKNEAAILEREKKAIILPEPVVPAAKTDTATVMTRRRDFQGDVEPATGCPSARSIFAAVDTDPDYLEVYVNTLRRDLSECLWSTITATKSQVDAEGTLGMVFGMTVEASAVVGYTTGTEFVVTLEPGTSNLLFGVYAYRGYDMGVGLPGVSAVQGFVYGNCGTFPLTNYTGWFRTLSGVANNYSYGKNGWWNWEDTRCNAWTVTRGLTTPILGFSRTYYMQEGRFLRVKGDYFAPTIAYLKTQK